MKQSRLPLPAEQRNGKLLADMPCWFQKQGCVISEPKGNVNLTFRCPCSSKESGLITQTVYIGKKTDVKEIASALATAVSRKHEGCHISKTDVDDLSQCKAEIQRLEKALAKQQRQTAQFEADNGLLKRKVEQGQAAEAQIVTAKRLKTSAVNKRQPIDTANQTDFKYGMKSHVMIGPKDTAATRGHPTFILDTFEYHCEGSERKLLTVVLDIISRYNLEDDVVGALGAATESTAAYIVQRARSALQELKQCQSEAQRQQYRTILTALAPEDGKAAPVAAALGVGRQKRPFLDAMTKRADIERQIKANKKRLQVGDDVLCRHGKGKVIELDSDYESEDEATAHPCSVELVVDGHKFVLKFSRTGAGRGGARLHRIPVSFAHGSRATRKDATTAEVEQMVSACIRRCCGWLSGSRVTQVVDFYEAECATSPCSKDKVRKRVGPKM